jgi:hypothetical protein
MVRTDINKNLIKTIGKYPIISGAELEDVEEVVEENALRKKKPKKVKTRKIKKKDCGCDKR